jgi:6-phosphogluconolactonase (cycloisomerase 2 family)
MITTYSRWPSIFALLSASLIASTSYALPFSITPTTGVSLPTTILAGQAATALYTVTNNTGIVRTGNYVKYLPPNVTQITSNSAYPDLCGSSFTLNAKNTSGSSCTLELAITGAIDSNDSDPHRHLFVCFPGGSTCAGTPYALNVTAIMPSASKFSYVANFNTNAVTLCSINASSGLFSACQDAGAGAIFNTPAMVIFNVDQTRAYVSNFGGSVGTTVSLCAVNRNSGTLSDCSNSDGDGTAIFNGPLGFSLDPSGTHAYIPSINSSSVTSCNVEQSTGKLTGCLNTGNPGDFTTPIDIVFNAAGTRAYISNTFIGTVSLCSVNTSTGALSGCVNADSDGTAIFAGPALMNMNASGSRLYVSNNNLGTGTSVSICSINLITGKLYGCSDSGVGSIFGSPVSVTLNAANTILYVSNNSAATVSSCSINSNTGRLNACVNSDGDGSAIFSGPAGVTLR